MHNPLGGEFHLLYWWTHNERGHVLLARSEQGLLTSAARIFAEHPHAKIHAREKVEIVAPPLHFVELAERYDREDRIEQFHSEVVARLARARDAGQSLPAPLATCSRYESELDVDEESRDWAFASHYGCRNCHDGIVLGMTKKELFERYAARWDTFFSSSYASSPAEAKERVPSRGRVASADEPLWYAWADFGHHANGIVLERVVVDPRDIDRPRYLSSEVLFFYRMIASFDATRLVLMLRGERSRLEEEKARLERERRERREREEYEDACKILALFQENDTYSYQLVGARMKCSGSSE